MREKGEERGEQRKGGGSSAWKIPLWRAVIGVTEVSRGLGWQPAGPERGAKVPPTPPASEGRAMALTREVTRVKICHVAYMSRTQSLRVRSVTRLQGTLAAITSIRILNSRRYSMHCIPRLLVLISHYQPSVDPKYSNMDKIFMIFIYTYLAELPQSSLFLGNSKVCFLSLRECCLKVSTAYTHHGCTVDVNETNQRHTDFRNVTINTTHTYTLPYAPSPYLVFVSQTSSLQQNLPKSSVTNSCPLAGRSSLIRQLNQVAKFCFPCSFLR